MVPYMPVDVPATHQIETHPREKIGFEKKQSAELFLAMAVLLEDFYARNRMPEDRSI